MHVDITSLAEVTGIPLRVVENYLGEPPIPVTEDELEVEIGTAVTLKQINRVLKNLPIGSELQPKAMEKKALLLSKVGSTACTILEWYELYRYTEKERTRNKARKRIEALFMTEFEEADSIERLSALYEKLPRRGRSLSHLRRQVILELATYFEA